MQEVRQRFTSAVVAFCCEITQVIFILCPPCRHCSDSYKHWGLLSPGTPTRGQLLHKQLWPRSWAEPFKLPLPSQRRPWAPQQPAPHLSTPLERGQGHAPCLLCQLHHQPSLYCLQQDLWPELTCRGLELLMLSIDWTCLWGLAASERYPCNGCISFICCKG